VLQSFEHHSGDERIQFNATAAHFIHVICKAYNMLSNVIGELGSQCAPGIHMHFRSATAYVDLLFHNFTAIC
jgi:hypothetical protein